MQIDFSDNASCRFELVDLLIVVCTGRWLGRRGVEVSEGFYIPSLTAYDPLLRTGLSVVF